ncbi:hypothetical protein TrLO_g11085 [Triparma laevis f. longispina]|uniref:3'-5' exonuclease domain-containing protein n=1 Tax=Triparma laevis f. longispina TaxID=1714387 RepID=A0A9W7FID4_9STRA|nr:hypothetical protein TrLO_g11085 [Triparma laevis f. longispina]
MSNMETQPTHDSSSTVSTEITALLSSLGTAIRATHSLPTTLDDTTYLTSFPQYSLLSSTTLSRITSILNSNPIENLPDTIIDLLTLPNSLLNDSQSLTLMTELGGKGGSKVNIHYKIQRPQTVYDFPVEDGKNGKYYTDHLQPFNPHPGISITKLLRSPTSTVSSSSIQPLEGHGYPPESIPQNCTLPTYYYPNPLSTSIDSFNPTSFMSLPIQPSTTFTIPTSHIDKRSNQLNSSTYIYIDSSSQLNDLKVKLSNTQCIVFDVEHNSLFSYSGLTCLIQLNVEVEGEEECFILDVLPLFDEIGELLNPSFSNPEVLKICHGGFNDVLWLQRDFGVYVVGLFDTYLAVKELEFERKSLKYLIEHYTSYEVDKKYQMEDWRVRPLGDGMRSYAVGDVYFLRYCYERLRGELGVEGVRKVFEGSKDVSKGRFMIKLMPEGGLEGLRERVAREEDVSGMVVLSENEMRRLQMHRPTKESDLKRLLRHDNLLAWQHRAEILLFFTASEAGGSAAPTTTTTTTTTATTTTSNSSADPPAARQPSPSAMQMNRNNLHSPVLTTETLYLTAGWITPNQFDDEPTSTPPFLPPDSRKSPTSLPPTTRRFETDFSVGVPKSVEEIYVRSNRSRRKKVDDENGDEDDNVEELPEGYLPVRKKGREGGEDVKQRIMEDVGWVKGGESEWKT